MSESEKEFIPNREEEVKKPIVKLFFFRHAQKESDDHDASDTMPLSDLGKKEAFQFGQKLSPDPESALAYVSKRVRTQETAARVMLASIPEINEHTTLKEIEKIVEGYLNQGKDKGPKKRKIVIDPRLDFRYRGEMASQSEKAIEEGQYLKWIIERSDQLARESGEPDALGFSRMASNIAEIMKKFGKVARHWDRLCREKPEKYEKNANRLERYLASHGGVLESFMIKVIRLSGSKPDEEEFKKQYPNGFSELDGFGVEIETIDESNIFRVSYKIGEEQKELEITEQVLEKIIEEARSND